MKKYRTAIDAVLLLLMFVAGYLVAKHVYYDAKKNEILEEIKYELRTNRIGLCKIPQTAYERAMMQYFHDENISIITDHIR